MKYRFPNIKVRKGIKNGTDNIIMHVRRNQHQHNKVIINITCYCNLYIGSRIKHIGHRQAQFHINKLSRKIYDIKTQIAHKPKDHSNGCFL